MKYYCAIGKFVPIDTKVIICKLIESTYFNVSNSTKYHKLFVSFDFEINFIGIAKSEEVSLYI